MRKSIFLFTALLGLLLSVACGANPDTKANVGAKTPANYSGSISLAGSSTVFPVAEVAKSGFKAAGFPGGIQVESIGSGAGFERFCGGLGVDIANASRPINESELSACRNNGLEPLEFHIGTDAIVVAVNAENDFATDLTYPQIQLLFSTAVYWSDIDPSWPNEPIARFAPGIKSGTFDFFVEEIFDGDDRLLLNTSRIEFSEDDALLAMGIENNKYAVGFFGYAFFLNHIDDLRALQVGGVQPNASNVSEQVYPLVRPLFMYTTQDILQSKPQVNAFMTYVLNNAESLITEVGYFPLDEVAYRSAKSHLIN